RPQLLPLPPPLAPALLVAHVFALRSRCWLLAVETPVRPCSVTSVMTCSPSVLLVSWGLRVPVVELSENFYDDGFTDVTSCDYSEFLSVFSRFNISGELIRGCLCRTGIRW